MVTIELYGVPQLTAKRREVTVAADTLSAALVALGQACPELCGVVVSGQGLAPGYVVAVNGQQITTDGGRTLSAGDVLVLMSAQAGG